MWRRLRLWWWLRQERLVGRWQWRWQRNLGQRWYVWRRQFSYWRRHGAYLRSWHMPDGTQSSESNAQFTDARPGASDRAHTRNPHWWEQWYRSIRYHDEPPKRRQRHHL